MNPVLSLLALPFLALFTGCATTASGPGSAAAKPPATQERGWIGGEYARITRRPYGAADAIHRMPRGLTNSCRDALLVTALGGDTPARLAGVQEGDLILEVNHRQVTTPRDFRRTVDRAQPGTPLTVLVWRDGRSVECNLAVGRETYEGGGAFCLTLPFFDGGFNLFWPARGLSLWVLGGNWGMDQRHDLQSLKGSAKEEYFSKQLGDKYRLNEREADWRAWLVCFETERCKTIRSQENVALRAAAPPAAAPAKPAN
jgi:hypothetical protein